MGTEVYYKSQVPGYYSMRDINEDSNSSSWSSFYGDKNLSNGQYYNGFTSRAATEYPGYEKHVLKQKMLEHEAVFKNQVCELHRVYRVQRDMMEEVQRKGLYGHCISIETSSSSSHLPSQLPADKAKNWHIPSLPLANSSCGRPCMLGSEVADSPLSCTKRNSSQADHVFYQNKCSSKDNGISDSPLSCTKRNSSQAHPVSYQIKCSSNDNGISESRPSKVRKKLFDLQLPADEYIDTEEEQFQDTKVSNVSSYRPNGDHRVATGSGIHVSLRGEKTDCHKDTSSNSCLKRSSGLADLNEPIQVEEDIPPICEAFLGHSASSGNFRGSNLPSKPRPQYIDLSDEFSQNSQQGIGSGNLKNHSVVSEGNRRGWLSYMYETGNKGRNPNGIPKFLQPEQFPVSSHPTPFIRDKSHLHSAISPADFRKEESWAERNHTYELTDRNRDFNRKYPDSIAASHVSSPYVNCSDVANSWSHSHAYWGQQNPSLTQKVTSVNTRPFDIPSEALSRNAQPSAQTHEIFGEKWQANCRSKLSSGIGSNLPTRNGFYHGSPSGSKEQPIHLSSDVSNKLNCNKLDNLASTRSFSSAPSNFFKDSDVLDRKSRKDIDLNVDLQESLLNEADPIADEKRKCEDHIAALPWLRKKPVCDNEAFITRKDLVEVGFLQSSCNPFLKTETAKDRNLSFGQNVSSASNGPNVMLNRESDECPDNGHILGYPVLGKLYTCKNDSSSLVSTSASKKNEGKHIGIDINVACELIDAESGEEIPVEALVAEKETNTTLKNFRNFDLNSCVREDEELLGSSITSTSARGKIGLEIDLEAPVIWESEEGLLLDVEHNQRETAFKSPEHKAEQSEDELTRVAAEAIVAISSCDVDHDMACNSLDLSEASLPDSLLWFAEAISSSAEGLESMHGRGLTGSYRGEIGVSKELDDFEAMTLQLEDTKEEDYMPKPFVPEFPEVEEIVTTSLPGRPRRGQARRGRQRRDFQRDILPGLVTLSRHEVTEDLQTFGGLMRATGHQWNGGSTRRNGTRSGAARGRRRCVVDPAPSIVVTPVCTPLMQQLNCVDVGMEDRSLTGWGKITRRPRRQRCGAGNNIAFG